MLGYINTAQFHELLEFTNHTLHTLEEKNRIISPQDLVDVTELLLNNSCISGQEIEVDGGLNLE